MIMRASCRGIRRSSRNVTRETLYDFYPLSPSFPPRADRGTGILIARRKEGVLARLRDRCLNHASRVIRCSDGLSVGRLLKLCVHFCCVTIVFAVDSQVRRETWMSLIFERKKYDKILIANIVYIYKSHLNSK